MTNNIIINKESLDYKNVYTSEQYVRGCIENVKKIMTPLNLTADQRATLRWQVPCAGEQILSSEEAIEVFKLILSEKFNIIY